MSIPLLCGLLKFWPFANCEKETLFLAELQEILDCCDIEKLKDHISKIIKRLVKCMRGSHLQVADRAMCFFEHESFIKIVKFYREEAYA